MIPIASSSLPAKNAVGGLSKALNVSHASIPLSYEPSSEIINFSSSSMFASCNAFLYASSLYFELIV